MVIQVDHIKICSFSLTGKCEELDDLVSNVTEKLPRINVPWLHRSNQATLESGVNERGTDNVDNTAIEESVPLETKNDEKESRTGIIDVSQFYILKKDTERRKVTQAPKTSTENSKLELNNTADFISFGSDSDGSDRSGNDAETLLKSQKRKYQYDSGKSERKMIKSTSNARPKFECAKVRRLTGNPNKVKKKKKKSKVKL